MKNEKRLDMLLSTPVANRAGSTGTSVGLYAAIALQTLVMGLLAALGVAGGGGDPVQPFIGVWIAGLMRPRWPASGSPCSVSGFYRRIAVHYLSWRRVN